MRRRFQVFFKVFFHTHSSAEYLHCRNKLINNELQQLCRCSLFFKNKIKDIRNIDVITKTCKRALNTNKIKHINQGIKKQHHFSATFSTLSSARYIIKLMMSGNNNSAVYNITNTIITHYGIRMPPKKTDINMTISRNRTVHAYIIKKKNARVFSDIPII